MAPVAGDLTGDLRRPPFWHFDAGRRPSTPSVGPFLIGRRRSADQNLEGILTLIKHANQTKPLGAVSCIHKNLVGCRIAGHLLFWLGSRIVLALMDRIDPRDLLRLLDRLDVEVNHNRFVVAAHKDTFERLILVRINFLVRHERRHIYKIARPSLRSELQMLPPAHSRFAADHIDYAFQLAVMESVIYVVRGK